jgi:hypothetical protein
MSDKDILIGQYGVDSKAVREGARERGIPNKLNYIDITIEAVSVDKKDKELGVRERVTKEALCLLEPDENAIILSEIKRATRRLYEAAMLEWGE